MEVADALAAKGVLQWKNSKGKQRPLPKIEIVHHDEILDLAFAHLAYLAVPPASAA